MSSAAARDHRCPVGGCDRTVPQDRLMCKGHWAMVPTGLRRAVWAAWRSGEGYGTNAHQEASAAALAAVERQLAARSGDQMSIPLTATPELAATQRIALAGVINKAVSVAADGTWQHPEGVDLAALTAAYEAGYWRWPHPSGLAGDIALLTGAGREALR